LNLIGSNKYLLLVGVLFTLVGSNANAQVSSTDYVIKDTVQLNQEITLLAQDIEDNEVITVDRMRAIMQSCLTLKDTVNYYLTAEKYLHPYFFDNELYDLGVSLFNEWQPALESSHKPLWDFNNSIGNLLLSSDKHIQALEYYFKSVEWYEQYDRVNTTYPLGNIAEVYYQNEDFEKSLEYSELTLSYTLEMPEGKDKLYCLIYDYYRLAFVYEKLNDTEKAAEYYEKALANCKEYDSAKLSAETISYALDFYSSTDNHKKCNQLIKWGDNLLDRNRKGRSKYWAGGYVLSRSRYYIKTGQLNKAIHPEDLDKIKNSYDKNKNEYSALYYVHIKDYENAISSYDDIVNDAKETNKGYKKQLFSNIEQRYLTEKLKRENKDLTEDIESNQKSMYYVLLAAGFILLFLILQMINNNRFRKVNKLLKKNKDTLENTNQKLTTANEELERFVFIASHDLKTPLSSIINFTELLDQELDLTDNSKEKKYLNFIKDGGLRLNDIIRDTLEYSFLSHQEHQTEVVDLNLIIAGIQNAQVSIKEEEKAIIKIGVVLPNLVAHKSSMTSLIQNIIENGLKYNDSVPPIINIWFEMDEEYFRLYIDDNGIGINKEYHDKIFTMFSRLHNYSDYSGTGLGLAICRKIMHELDGHIYLKSKEGPGSLFVLDFPKDLIVSTPQVIPS